VARYAIAIGSLKATPALQLLGRMSQGTWLAPQSAEEESASKIADADRGVKVRRPGLPAVDPGGAVAEHRRNGRAGR
jgi:hypothetical protein